MECNENKNGYRWKPILLKKIPSHFHVWEYLLLEDGIDNNCIVKKDSNKKRMME
jgi:hypothetical protein